MHIISGQFKNRPLNAPKSQKTRPTSSRLREALFNICQTYIEGTRFLDLFAGSGAVGFEALSRGAHSAVFVDNSRESLRCMQENAKLLGVEKHSEIIFGDVFEMMHKLARKGQSFEIIYADPPYEQATREDRQRISMGMRVVQVIDELADQGLFLLAPHGTLFLEDAAEAINKDIEFKHLVLQSNRRSGRSGLNQYVSRQGN